MLLALVLPPANLPLFCLAGLLLARRHRRAGRALAGGALALLIVLSLPLVAQSLLAPLERGLPLTPPAADPPQAIVILGGDVSRTFLGVADGQEPRVLVGGLTLERLRAGALLERATHLPVLVTGGVIGNHGPTLAALMAASFADDFGVATRWQEPAARDTWENARLSADILKAQGIHSIYLVTHPWHMRRALIAFRPTGLVVTAAPTQLDLGPMLDLAALIPRAASWSAIYFALHEWIGCAVYALRS